MDEWNKLRLDTQWDAEDWVDDYMCSLVEFEITTDPEDAPDDCKLLLCDAILSALLKGCKS